MLFFICPTLDQCFTFLLTKCLARKAWEVWDIKMKLYICTTFITVWVVRYIASDEFVWNLCNKTAVLTELMFCDFVYFSHHFLHVWNIMVDLFHFCSWNISETFTTCMAINRRWSWLFIVLKWVYQLIFSCNINYCTKHGYQTRDILLITWVLSPHPSANCNESH